MKSELFIILAFAFISSCERQRVKPSVEPSSGKSQEPPTSVDAAISPSENEATPPANLVSPTALVRIFHEADQAFEEKQYDIAVAKIEEFLQKLGPHSQGAPYELLYFNLGLAHLLNGSNPEAEEGFKDYLKRYPKGEFVGRSYLGVGRACMRQGGYEKIQEALKALKKAAEDPRTKPEADLLISQLSQSSSDQ